MSHLLLSPLAGWSTPLEEVPDPVFSGRMVGEGLAVDPLGSVLHAPCDGQVLAVPETKHAVTLRTPYGVDILMHIGIDTVGLRGEGFVSHIEPNQRVRAGEPLITFDLDRLAQRAKSLVTPVLVLEGSGFAIGRRVQGCQVAVGDVLMELEPVAVRAGAAQQTGAETVVRSVRIALEHGIHARPAGRIVAALKGLTAQVRVRMEGREANARSAVALMGLGAQSGAQVDILASGADAAQASDAVAAVLTGSEGEPSAAQQARAAEGRTATEVAGSQTQTQTPASDVADTPGELRGVIANRGLAVGRARVVRGQEIHVREAGEGLERESADLRRAVGEIRERLQRSRDGAAGTAREIVEAHLTLLEDPELAERSAEQMARGASAAFAWRSAIHEHVRILRGLEDPRLRERVDDLIDLERQVLLALSGASATTALELDADSILMADELLPSQLVSIEAGKLAGICLAGGGATSHVAILAAAQGIPALVALGDGVRRVAEGTPLILDAEAGRLHIDPGEARLASVRRQIADRAARDALEREAAQRECRTADGARIEVFANVGSVAEAETAARNGAEGCGLLRTEFLFLQREQAPPEVEQRAEYQRIAAALAGRPVVIRTMDIGGDKPIPYLPLPEEDNPALGLRGVRTSLWRSDLLREQLRAIVGVKPYGQCRILLPMVTDVAEIRVIRAMADEARAQIGRREPIDIGVMIETPASALMAAVLAEEADFFSVGTNDLTQYTLAMDRGHSELASRLDALHPAVLQLIGRTVEAARPRRRPVAVCGGLASDPTAAAVLVGLGVDELSCVPSVVPRLKALIGGLTMEDCRRLARAALACDSAEAVRALCASPSRASQPAPVAG